MSYYKNKLEQVDHACEVRTEAAKAEPKNGQTIVSHVSTVEVQPTDFVESMVRIRSGGHFFADGTFDPNG